MTRNQFDNIKWTMVSHLSGRDGHESLYKSNTQFFTIYKSVFVPFRNDHPTNIQNIAYSLNGKWYKSIDKLLGIINKK